MRVMNKAGIILRLTASYPSPLIRLLQVIQPIKNASQDGSNTALYQYATNSIVGRLTYDYKGKYLAEFSFRDDKSSKFSPQQGWGFFPSASLGWRISDENFWKNSSVLSVMDNFKFRASYGVLGDDGTLYYQFLSGYNYPAGGSANQLPSGAVFGNYLFKLCAKYRRSKSKSYLVNLAYF